MRVKKWIALATALGAAVLFIYGDAFSNPRLSSGGKEIPTSVQPGASQGQTGASDRRLNSSIGEIRGSTLTSTNYYFYPGAQYLLTWPGSVTSLSALTGDNANEIKLRWTAPGADGSVGNAKNYIVKYRLAGPILTDADFNAANTAYISTRTPKGPGTFESHVLTGLSAGPTYYFAMVVYDSFTVSGYLSNGASSWAFGPPDLEPPGSISDLTAVTGDVDGRVFLSWTSPGDDHETGTLDSGRYRIHGSTMNFQLLMASHSSTQFGSSDFDIDFSTTGVAPGTRVGYVVNGLNPGTTVYFGALARDDSANWTSFRRAAPFNSLSSAPARDLPLSAPTDVAVQSVSENELTASWTVPSAPEFVDDRFSYRLYTATSNFNSLADSWVHLSSEVAHPLTTAASAQLNLNATYYFAVAAVDSGTIVSGLYSAALVSDMSAILSTPTLAAPPGAGTFAEVHRASATIAWDPGSNPTSPLTQYEAQFSTAQNFGAYSSSFTYLLQAATSTLAQNTTYFARTRAINRGGHPSNFNTWIATATLTNSPGIVGFEVFTTSVTALLASNFNPTGTRICITTGNFDTSASSAGVFSGATTALTLLNLSPNTAYSVFARAMNHQNLKSSQTVVMTSSATLPAVPGANTFEEAPAAVGYTSIVMRWDPNGNPLTPPTSYEMQVSTWDGFAGTVTSSFTFNVYASTDALTPDTSYFFRVRAFGVGGTDSDFNSFVTTYTLDNIPPSAITSVTAFVGTEGGQIELSWIAPGDNGAAGQAAVYEIKSAIPPYDWVSGYDAATLVTNSMPANPAGTNETYTVQGLTPGTTYAFVVRARDEAANLAPLSNGATKWAALANFATSFYLTSDSVSNPVSARSLSLSTGAGSNTSTIVRPATNNNYYVLRPLINYTGNGDVALPAATTTYGWIYDASLAGLTVESGVWTLRGSYRYSATNLTGSLHYRLNRVTVTATSTTLRGYLTQGPNGWEQWGSGNLAATTIFVATQTTTSVNETYFEPGDRLMVEYAFRPTGGSNGTRQFGWEISVPTSVIRSGNIYDFEPPSQVTGLTALNENLNEGEVRLEWLAPGDDGTYGQAAYYDIRYTDDSSFNWANNFDAAGIWKSSRTVGGPSRSFESELVASTGLAGGTTYYFALRAYDENGNSSLSSAATQWAMVDRIPPANISDLTALVGNVEAAINLMWTAPGDNLNLDSLAPGSTYQIRASTVSFAFYSSTSEAFAPSDITVTIATSAVSPGDRQGYVLTGLYPGATWYFGIFTWDDRGNASFWRKTGAANVRHSTWSLDLALGPPELLSANSVSSTSVTLGWTNPAAPAYYDDRASYRLYSASSPFTSPSDGWVHFSSSVAHPLSNATTAQARPNQFYYFRTAAFDLGNQGAGLYSASLASNLSDMISTCTLAEIPGSLQTSEVNRSSISVSWSSVNNPLIPPTTYQVSMSTSDNFVPETSSVTFNLSATTAALSFNTTYYFKVRAINQLELPTEYTTPISTVTLASTATLNSPNWAAADVGVTVSTARWNANNNPQGTLYRVQFATSANFAGAVTSSDTYNLFASSSGLLGSATMVFRVQAVNHRGLGSDFVLSQATVTRPGALSLMTPHWASADVGVMVSTARWTDSGNAAGALYHVEFSTSSNFAGAVTSSHTFNLFASSAALLGNTTLVFRVTAVNADDEHGDYLLSDATATLAAGGTFTPPPAASVGMSSIAISWPDPGNQRQTLYRVLISTSSDFSTFTTSETFVLSVSTESLLANTSYHFRGWSQNHQARLVNFTADITTPTHASPPKTAQTTFTVVTPADITAQWDSNGNPPDTMYYIYVATKADFSAPDISTFTATDPTVTATGLLEDTTYHFRVQAMSRQGIFTEIIPIGSTLTTISTDFNPPRNISDLTGLVGDIDGRIFVQWTSPGDDLWTGALDNGRYRVRYSTTNFNHFSSTYPDLSGVQAAIGLGDVFITTTGVNPGTAVGYVMDGLNPGSTYYLAVIARDDSSNWSFFNRWVINEESSAPARDLPLASPANPALVGVSSTVATISWTLPAAPSNIDDRALYQLYVATSEFDSPLQSWVHVSSAVAHPLTSAATEQLTPNTSYSFRISAIDWGDRGDGLYSEALESALSAGFSTFTLAEIPGANGFLAVNTASATVGWSSGGNPLTPPTSYEMLISTSSDFGANSSSVTFTLSASSFTLSPNATYYFKTRAYNRVGLPSDYNSIIATATLASSVTLNSLNWASADVGISVSTARWNTNGNPPYTLYRVQYATSSDFGGAVTSSDTYTTFSSTSGLLGNTTIAFRAAGVNVHGLASVFVFSQATATLANVPLEGAPTSFFDVYYTSVALQWNTNNNAAHTEYQLEISTTVDFSGASDAATDWGRFALATHTFISLIPETTYHAKIKGRNSQGMETAFTYLGTTVTLDNIAPGSASGLTALTGVTEGIINFSWIAPGDNQYSGVLKSGSRFHIATTTVLGDAQNPSYWTGTIRDNAEIQIATSNVLPGTTRYHTVTGLTGGTTYYFRVWTQDESGNWSALSQGATGWAQQDVTAPAAITDLTALKGSTINVVAINLSWTMPGDDGLTGNIVGGTVTVKFQSLAQGGAISESNFEAAKSTYNFYHSTAQGIAFTVPITGLTSETTYYFAVKLRDERGNISTISNSTYCVSPDTVPPSGITSLTALTGSDTGEIVLRWIAPGDNGTVGQAYRYEIRRAIPPFDWLTNFDNAVLVTNTMDAGETRSLEEYIVGGLTPGTTYAFAVRSVDESANQSELSNGATAWAALPNDTTTFYLRGNDVTNPLEAKALTTGPGTGSNTTTRVTPATGNDNNYYILRPVVTVTGNGVASLPSATTTFGWLYDASLAGLTVQGGSWTLKGRYEMSAIGLTGRLHYRINRVTVTSTSTTLKSFLTQGPNGWVQWGSGPLPNFTTLTTTVAIASVNQTYFEAGDRLMVEYAFQPTGSNSTRRFHWEVNDSSNVIRTSNINDVIPPNAITTLVAFGTSAFLNDGQIRLEWTAPGDDGTVGQAVFYDIRYSDNENFNWSLNFDAATLWKSFRASGGESGYEEIELVTNTGLVAGVTYYFSMKAYDNENNSSLSNAATAQAGYDEIGVLIVGATTYSYGLWDLSSSTVSLSSFTVRNAGNVLQDYALNGTTVTTDTPWALSASQGTDLLVLRAGFSPARPIVDDFGSEDIIQYYNQSSNDTKYAIAASSGVTVPIGEDRYLWLRLDTPLLTSTTEQQTIRVNITASASP